MNVNFKSPSPFQGNKQAKNMSFKEMIVTIGKKSPVTNGKNPVTTETIEKLLPPGTGVQWSTEDVYFESNNDKPDFMGTFGILHTKPGSGENELIKKLNGLYNQHNVFFNQYEEPHSEFSKNEDPHINDISTILEDEEPEESVETIKNWNLSRYIDRNPDPKPDFMNKLPHFSLKKIATDFLKPKYDEKFCQELDTYLDGLLHDYSNEDISIKGKATHLLGKLMDDLTKKDSKGTDRLCLEINKAMNKIDDHLTEFYNQKGATPE